MPRKGKPTEGSAKPYAITAVLRACDVLAAFRDPSETLSLAELAQRAGLSRPTAFRMLISLAERGLVERLADRTYRSRVRLSATPQFRIGYASQSAEFAFTRAVDESIVQAAAEHNIELLMVDNKYSRTAALRNADFLVRQKVDLVIEFQTASDIAPVVSSRYLQADIPMIAVEIPHPGAVYYGADNYHAGRLGGRFLAQWAQANWQGAVDEVVLLELPVAGPLPQSRITGSLDGILELLPGIPRRKVVRLDGNGQFNVSLSVVRKYLRNTQARRALVTAINDPSALGALQAFRESGREAQCAIVSQNASYEARQELRRKDSRLIGAVAYFPERYGDGVMRLAVDILNKRQVPPAVFVKHRLLTPQNVGQVYPNDIIEDLVRVR